MASSLLTMNWSEQKDSVLKMGKAINDSGVIVFLDAKHLLELTNSLINV